MIFCVAVVSLYSKFIGNDNSVVGVTVLLAVLVLRQADFGIRTTHGLASIAGIYAILMAGPRLANMVSPVPAFFINAAPYHAADDPRMPQCDHVQSLYFCPWLSIIIWI